MGSLLTFHVNMQAVQKFAGGAKSCSEDAMVTRGLLMFQNSQKSPINNQQNLTLSWEIPHGPMNLSGMSNCKPLYVSYTNLKKKKIQNYYSDSQH
jgi:hypothetical protein